MCTGKAPAGDPLIPDSIYIKEEGSASLQLNSTVAVKRSAGAMYQAAMSAARLAFLCILAGSSLNYGAAYPVGNSLSNVCDYAHLSKCIWDDLVTIRSRRSASQTHTLSILNTNGMGTRSDNTKQRKADEDKINTHFWQPKPTICQWHYELDADYLRVPVYVLRAVLDDKRSDSNAYNLNRGSCQCSPIEVKLPVSMFHTCSNGQEEWVMEKLSVNAGYTCRWIH